MTVTKKAEKIVFAILFLTVTFVFIYGFLYFHPSFDVAIPKEGMQPVFDIELARYSAFYAVSFFLYLISELRYGRFA